MNYRRRSALQARVPPSEIPHTLEGGVLSVFPDTNPRRLAAWLDETRAAAATESELLLFLVLIAGVRLRVGRDELVPVFENLWTWLTSAPRRMPPALAELVIEALTPELKRAIERRGWRFGPGGELIKRRGRPPEARAAWTAALLAEHHLVAHGALAPKARTLATSLAAVLLGRESVESPEFYRTRHRIGIPDPSRLDRAIRERYETWLAQHAIQVRDPAAPNEEVELRAAWRERHRPLTQFLGSYGAEQFARLILEEIPEAFWAPFSRLGVSTNSTARKPNPAKTSVRRSRRASSGPRNPHASISARRPRR